MKKHLVPIITVFIICVGIASTLVISNTKEPTSVSTNAQQTAPTMTVIAKNLQIPWALAFLPNASIIFTERPGTVKVLNPANGQITQIASISEVKHQGEGGLLGIAIHPQFASNNFIYVYYTYGSSGNNTLNKVVRYTFSNNQLTAPITIVDAIPGASNHNGGRLTFGPDGFLYITTGDAANPSLAQDRNSLAGKILRVTDAGLPAPGNPFTNRTYSYGHRNPQGIAWNGTTMYATEHGQSYKDEVNLIQPGKNYGWPTIEGDVKQSGLESPLAHSGTNSWAPSGTAFYNGSIFFAGLRGTALFEATPQAATASIKEHFKGQLGRIREVVVGPDNMLYITTSNRDGRGSPKADDDKIIKVSFAGTTAPTNTQPTFHCIGGVPCTSPGQPSIVPSNVTPQTTIPQPSTHTTPITAQPSQTPCDVSESSIQSSGKKQHKKKFSKDNQQANKGFIEAFIQLLIRLLEQLLQLIGIPTGNATPITPAPSVDPCPTP